MIDPAGGSFTVDVDLVVRAWDAWLARVTGIPAAEAVGRPLATLAPTLAPRGLLDRVQGVLDGGEVVVLAPALHGNLIPCPPQAPAAHFAEMQQRVTIAPLYEGARVVGAEFHIEDVTARRERERTLAAGVQAPSPEARLAAIRALGAEPAEVAAAPLAAALGDSNWRVRREAVAALAAQRGPEVTAVLVQILRDHHDDPSRLNGALQALAAQGLDPLPALLALMAAPEADLRTYTAQALGAQADPRATNALLGALDDPDVNVRYHAIEALGGQRARQAVPILGAIATAGDFFLAFPALDALARIGDPRGAAGLAPLLADPLLGEPAAAALGELGDEAAVPALVGALNAGTIPAAGAATALARLYDRYEQQYHGGAQIADRARGTLDAAGRTALLAAAHAAGAAVPRALILVLGWLDGADAAQALVAVLGRSDVREEAISALVRHGIRATGLLLPDLESPDPDTRRAVALALGRIGDTRAVPALIGVLTTDGEPAIAAAEALAKIGDSRAFEPLLTRLGDPDARVRQAVVAALNSLGHPDMAARMTGLLGDADPLVRESAVRVAGYFGYAACAAALHACCADPDEAVRRAAVEHLPYLEDDPAVVSLLEAALRTDTPGVRAAAARALAHMEPALAVPLLLTSMEDPDPWVRYFAARSLGRHAAGTSIPALAGIADADPAPQVRIAALEALGQIGGPEAVSVLTAAAESGDPDRARAARLALERLTRSAVGS
ncbi:MAG TPA: HEAT repeat domain-containing protein [Chloroflexia bacterium]|nr:HEAT repeat domain-containing protein [Chloroflexia bacterium]